MEYIGFILTYGVGGDLAYGVLCGRDTEAADHGPQALHRYMALTILIMKGEAVLEL